LQVSRLNPLVGWYQNLSLNTQYWKDFDTYKEQHTNIEALGFNTDAE